MDNLELMSDNSRQIDREYQYQVHTFGCKVNTYDSGLIQKNLNQNGYRANSSSKSQIHVLNTCAVTSEATQQAVRMIRKIKAIDPMATIVVTGCAAQVDTGAFENLSGADLVVANSHKGQLPFLIDQFFKKSLQQRVFKSNIFKKEELEADGGEEQFHTRSFLKIQDGCNSFCSFCIIPYARGKSRSIPINDIISKIKDLEMKDVKEVVLTGVHIGDYEDVGSNKIYSLDDLVEAVLEKTKIPRIRLSSLEPIEISDRLIELYKLSDRLCRHFHLSIQSADSSVLKEMKRKYSQEHVRLILSKIESELPNSYIGMDVIAGFPSETDDQFENTYRLLAETSWTRLHVFPYSERSGTKAATMNQIPFSKRKERARLLRELSLHKLQASALQQVGTSKKMLTLNNANGKYDGVSRDYWNVKLQNPAVNYSPNIELVIAIRKAEFTAQEVVLVGEEVENNV